MAQIKEYLLDTNVILRHIKQDGKRQHIEQAHKVFRELDTGKIKVSLVESVVVELCYVLTFYYNLSRSEFVQVFTGLLEAENIKADKGLYEKAIKIYSATELDITDCILIAKYQLNKGKFADILSFDDELAENKSIKV